MVLNTNFIVLSCLLFIDQPVECYGYSYNLANVSNYYDADGTQYYIGTLEVCVNGSYYPSCLDSLPEDICTNIYSSTSGKLIFVAASSLRQGEDGE